MKPYEGCAVCAVNELREDCTYMSCVFTLASKEDLLSRLSDNIHYTPYEHTCIREALSDVYDFDYECKTTKELPEQIYAEFCEKNNTSQKDTCDMKCDGSNCYKCLFWKLSNLNICENECFTLASEKELIRRLDEYENRRDDIIKTLKEQYGYDYETKSIIDLDSGIRFKNVETNNEGDDVPMHLNDMINMDNSKRISKVEYYLGIADAVSKRGTCLRRNYGAVIVKDDHIVSTGYNGAPRGRINCCDLGTCFRKENNIPQGQRYERCRSCHAEMNAIINASPEEMNNSDLYLVGRNYDDGTLTDADCCTLCKRMVINAGIKRVIVRLANGASKCIDVNDWIEDDDTLNMD